jgi:hypothetical protein
MEFDEIPRICTHLERTKVGINLTARDQVLKMAQDMDMGLDCSLTLTYPPVILFRIPLAIAHLMFGACPLLGDADEIYEPAQAEWQRTEGVGEILSDHDRDRVVNKQAFVALSITQPSRTQHAIPIQNRIDDASAERVARFEEKLNCATTVAPGVTFGFAIPRHRKAVSPKPRFPHVLGLFKHHLQPQTRNSSKYAIYAQEIRSLVLSSVLYCPQSTSLSVLSLL